MAIEPRKTLASMALVIVFGLSIFAGVRTLNKVPQNSKDILQICLQNNITIQKINTKNGQLIALFDAAGGASSQPKPIQDLYNSFKQPIPLQKCNV